MKAIIKRVIFKDEWIIPGPGDHRWLVRATMKLFRWVIPRYPAKTYQFTNYALGFRWEASPRELDTIQSKDLFGQPALTIRDGDAPIFFADLLGPEFIAEINPSQTELLRVEGKVREAAMLWTHSFETMTNGG